MKKTMISLLCLCLVGCGINLSPGTGEKIGQIVKISRVGMSCDTWEGQLIRGGISDGSGSFGTIPFNFTIEDAELVDQAIKYLRNQTEVVVYYNTEGVYSLCRSEWGENSSNGTFLIKIVPKDSL